MPVSNRHILEQGAALGALGRVAIRAIEQQLRGAREATTPSVPGPVVEATFAPRRAALVRDYIEHVGGDPEAYRGRVPAHFFPQWAFGMASKVLDGLPYPMARVLNVGCDLTQRAPIPQGEPLLVRAHLESIDDDGRRAILQTRVITSTPSVKDAVTADMFAMVPLKRAPKSDGDRKEPERVPEDAGEVAHYKLGTHAGLDFAKLTGDFNPIHWVRPAARAAGFPNVILHGFATMARAIEGLNQGVFDGDPNRLKVWRCRFTKPLVLPAQAGVYVRQKDVFVGGALGGPAYLVGSYEA